MKKFYTAVPFRMDGGIKKLRYNAVDNCKLQYDEEIRFPISAAVNGYIEEGEQIEVIGISKEIGSAPEYLAMMKEEINAICATHNCPPAIFHDVLVPNDEGVEAQLQLFQTLIALADDNDELFCCVTYNTKILVLTLITALQYAYRLRKNCSIQCVLYGELDRRNNPDPEAWVKKIYDITALIQMGEMLNMLAKTGVENPAAAIHEMLGI